MDDPIYKRANKWQDELEKLKMIILDCQLNEEMKWGWPCFTYQKKNIVILQGFKEYFAVLFFKGALLQDIHGILSKTGENTQVARQLRFTKGSEIDGAVPILKSYVYEAIEVEKSGLKVDIVKNTELAFPEEFKQKLEETPGLKSAFEALTPGRQRAYNLFFSAPKQSQTRTSRVEKCIPNILLGKGLNDQ